MGVRSAILFLILAAPGGTGCVTCSSSECHRTVREAGPGCALPLGCRDKVHAFLITGLNPAPSAGFEDLRAELNRRGFSKVGLAGVAHGAWVWDQMVQIRCKEPGARFVLVGNDVGAAWVTGLAARAVRKELPIEAVVLLDPVARTKKESSGHVVIIRSGVLSSTEEPGQVLAQGATPFNLASHPTTIETIAALMEETATKIQAETPIEAELLKPGLAEELNFPLPILSSEEKARGWDFLDGRPGGTSTTLATGVKSAPPPAPETSEVIWWNFLRLR